MRGLELHVVGRLLQWVRGLGWGARKVGCACCRQGRRVCCSRALPRRLLQGLRWGRKVVCCACWGKVCCACVCCKLLLLLWLLRLLQSPSDMQGLSDEGAVYACHSSCTLHPHPLSTPCFNAAISTAAPTLGRSFHFCASCANS